MLGPLAAHCARAGHAPHRLSLQCGPKEDGTLEWTWTQCRPQHTMSLAVGRQVEQESERAERHDPLGERSPEWRSSHASTASRSASTASGASEQGEQPVLMPLASEDAYANGVLDGVVLAARTPPPGVRRSARTPRSTGPTSCCPAAALARSWPRSARSGDHRRVQRPRSASGAGVLSERGLSSSASGTSAHASTRARERSPSAHASTTGARRALPSRGEH